MSTERYLMLSTLLIASACEPPQAFVPPRFESMRMVNDNAVLSNGARVALEGNYLLSGDTRGFGSAVVLRTTRAGISLFGAENGAYAAMRGACVGASFVLEGYWRHATNHNAGLVRFVVESAAANASLCANSAPTEALSLRGGFTENNDENIPVQSTLSFTHRLVEGTERFHIIAHQGCRTIEDCGASENTIEVTRLVEAMGATGIELDVELTRDLVPVLFHDPVFSSRLTRGRYCVGNVRDFTFAAVRELCAAKYGEPIPRMQDALRVIIDETQLSLVWLDIKTPDAIAPVMDLVEAEQEHAASIGRELNILLGMPDEQSLDSFVALRGARPLKCVYEIEPERAVAAGCSMWGPRWTRGPSSESARTLQEQGVEVAFWTLNEPSFIDEVLRSAAPNAIVTDRPGVVLQRLQEIGVLAPELAP